MFSAKVASLRDKYGHAIVADLLEKADHRQASKVSVIMHVSDDVETGMGDIIKGSGVQNANVLGFDHDNIDPVGSDTGMSPVSVLVEGEDNHSGFKSNGIKTFPRVSNFSRDLILSYRYRTRF